MKLVAYCIFIATLSLTAFGLSFNHSSHLIASDIDSECLTQGFSFMNDTHILHSCGMWGKYFQIYEYNRTINKLIRRYRSPNFDKKYFLQGSIYYPKNQIIYILTYQTNVVFLINSTTYQQIEKIAWHSEGWGMTHNGQDIIISDGSQYLYMVDERINIKKKICVRDEKGNRLMKINELQWVREGQKQYIYANLFNIKDQGVKKIDLQTGKVVKSFYFEQMIKIQNPPQFSSYGHVMNGIAFDQQNGNFLLTGKCWAHYYLEKLLNE